MTLDPASISALAAIFGSLTGAFASSVSTWITQRHQDRREDRWEGNDYTVKISGHKAAHVTANSQRRRKAQRKHATALG